MMNAVGEQQIWQSHDKHDRFTANAPDEWQMCQTNEKHARQMTNMPGEQQAWQFIRNNDSKVKYKYDCISIVWILLLFIIILWMIWSKIKHSFAWWLWAKWFYSCVRWYLVCSGCSWGHGEQT